MAYSGWLTFHSYLCVCVGFLLFFLLSSTCPTITFTCDMNHVCAQRAPLARGALATLCAGAVVSRRAIGRQAAPIRVHTWVIPTFVLGWGRHGSSVCQVSRWPPPSLLRCAKYCVPLCPPAGHSLPSRGPSGTLDCPSVRFIALPDGMLSFFVQQVSLLAAFCKYQLPSEAASGKN